MAPASTRENLRHAVAMLRYGANPAATVYDSIGPDFFLALAPGWLNLGLWEGDGGDPRGGAGRRPPTRRADRGGAAGRRRRPRRRQRPRRPGSGDRGGRRAPVAHGGEHHVVPAGGGTRPPAGGRRPRRVRGRVPAPVRRRLVRRRDQRGGGVPFLLARAVPRARRSASCDPVASSRCPTCRRSVGPQGLREAVAAVAMLRVLGSPARAPPPRPDEIVATAATAGFDGRGVRAGRRPRGRAGPPLRPRPPRRAPRARAEIPRARGPHDARPGRHRCGSAGSSTTCCSRPASPSGSPSRARDGAPAAAAAPARAGGRGSL